MFIHSVFQTRKSRGKWLVMASACQPIAETQVTRFKTQKMLWMMTRNQWRNFIPGARRQDIIDCCQQSLPNDPLHDWLINLIVNWLIDGFKAAKKINSHEGYGLHLNQHSYILIVFTITCTCMFMRFVYFKDVPVQHHS